MNSDKEKLSISQKISILNERQMAFAEQQKRFFSHIDSERAHFKTYSDLIKSIEFNLNLQTEIIKKDIGRNTEALNELKDLIKKHDLILLNSGKGLVFEVDRLNQRAAYNKEGRAVIIALIGVAISVLGFIMEHINIFTTK